VFAHDGPDHRIVVGWDQTLQSYFGQAWVELQEPWDKYYHLLYRCGSEAREVNSLGELAEHMRAVAEVGCIQIPEATLAELRDPVAVSLLHARKHILSFADLYDWLREEPCREGEGNLRTGAGNVHEPERRPLQGYHPKLTHER
jgi:hypothetical protein